jgi:hypothetical protein
MLGLSQGVSSSAGVYERFPVVSYSSDFSSSADGFTAHFDNDPSAATLTGGIDFGGKTDVLRISWSADESDGLFYIRKSFSDLDDQDGLSPVITFSADFYYDFTTSGDVSMVVGAGHFVATNNRLVNEAFPQGQWVTVSGSIKSPSDTSFDEFLHIGIADAVDKPANGDNMYVANIVFSFEDKD